MRNTIIVFDPSLSTGNMGDYIISESLEREMSFLFKKHFLTTLPTHTPIKRFWAYSKTNTWIDDACIDSKYKFLGGTDLIHTSLKKDSMGWIFGKYDFPFYQNVISIGCGTYGNEKKIGIRAKRIYEKILNKEFVHSTRDERTAELLNTIPGVKAVNTGCPTMWMLDEKHCATIPPNKSDRVVFTLADRKDVDSDQALIDILNKSYSDVYFYPQGIFDLSYFYTLKNISNINVVGSQLSLYKDLLSSGGIDYVGLRLHGGIYALQNHVRSIIIAVDNRARDMDKTYNLNCIERSMVGEELEERIHSSWNTEIRIDSRKISEWKRQFE